MELRPIARDVYACLQEDRGLGYSNSGLVNRGGGLVVDTFWDLPHTRRLLESCDDGANPHFFGYSFGNHIDNGIPCRYPEIDVAVAGRHSGRESYTKSLRLSR